MTRSSFIGIDVGTTSVKAVLVETGGRMLDSFSLAHPTQRPRSGHVEQDPSDWMAGVMGALHRFAASGAAAGVRGIALCSQVNTHVFVDERGQALRPAIVWQDGRCADEASRLDALIPPERKIGWFGAPIPIDASNALSRMAYVARHEPEIFARTRYVLLPKDYCTLALTGAVATDPIAAIGLVDRSLRYIDELLALVPGAGGKLAPLADFTHVLGPVRPGLPFAGVPVMVGAMDAWSGMFGLGVARDGQAMYQSGTSEIPGVISSRVMGTPGVVLFPPYHGITMHAAPTQAGGAALAWVARLLGRGVEELDGMAQSVPEAAAIPLFLPHLEGERAPLWDSRTRGVFARLEAANGPGEIVRSVMEGVALAVRLAFDALEASAGAPIAAANLGGGGARSDLWCQIRADALGRTLPRASISAAGALGAAIIAGLGCGEMASLESATAELVHFDRTFEPDPSRRAYYDDRFEKYRQLYRDLRPFNDTFSSASAQAVIHDAAQDA